MGLTLVCLCLAYRLLQQCCLIAWFRAQWNTSCLLHITLTLINVAKYDNFVAQICHPRTHLLYFASDFGSPMCEMRRLLPFRSSFLWRFITFYELNIDDVWAIHINTVTLNTRTLISSWISSFQLLFCLTKFSNYKAYIPELLLNQISMGALIGTPFFMVIPNL